MPDKIPRDAYALVVGAMKCGTSSLFHYLRGHPELCPAIVKEPEFFSEAQGHGLRVEDYGDLFSFDRSVHKYALEASTGYTKYPQEKRVAKNIFDYGIRPSLIYIIRNPFERSQSHLNHDALSGRWIPDIGRAASTSNYFLQLEQYRRYFPLEDILVLDFDELKATPALVLRRVYEFLDLSDCYLPDTYQAENVTPNHPNASRLSRNILESRVGPLLGRMPKPLKKLGHAILHSTLPAGKRILSSQERNFIYDELKNDMSSLHRVYDFDVGKWGF